MRHSQKNAREITQKIFQKSQKLQDSLRKVLVSMYTVFLFILGPFIRWIHHETNNYLKTKKKKSKSMKQKKKSHNDIWSWFSVLLCKGLVRMNNSKNYWKNDQNGIFGIKFIQSTLSKNKSQYQ
jgi:ABC-type Fe3+ transport system permease subunit